MNDVHTAFQVKGSCLGFVHMAFSFSGNIVAFCFNNRTTKACLCNQSGTVSLLSRLANSTLYLANKHGIALIPAYIQMHLGIETESISWRRLVPE